MRAAIYPGEGKPVTSFMLTEHGRRALESHARRLMAALSYRRVNTATEEPETVTVGTTSSVTFNTAGALLVYWQVSYTSTNPAQTDIAATCSENTSLTITN